MKSIEISEPIFRDLIACKSKIEDIKIFMSGNVTNISKARIVREITGIAFDKRYMTDKTEG